MAIKDSISKFGGTAASLGLNLLQSKGAEPQMGYKWKVVLPKISGVKKEPYLESVVWPFSSLNTTSLHIGSSLEYFPGTEEVPGLSLVVFQDNKGDALQYFNAWNALIKNKDGTHNYPSKYKLNLTLKLQDKLDREVFNLKCFGCFPKSISPMSLAYDSSERVKLNVDLSVDRLVLTQVSSGIAGKILSTIF